MLTNRNTGRVPARLPSTGRGRMKGTGLMGAGRWVVVGLSLSGWALAGVLLLDSPRATAPPNLVPTIDARLTAIAVAERRRLPVATPTATPFPVATPLAVPVQIASAVYNPDLRSPSIVGTVRNDTGRPLTSVRVAATLFDRGGRIVAVKTQPVWRDILAPDDWSPFEIMLFDVPLFDSFEIQAQGNPRD